MQRYNMPLDDINRLGHILESAIEAQEFMKDVSIESLPADRKTIQAVTRNLEIIGEAAKNIPAAIKKQYPDIPWKNIIAMRNIISHEYFGISKEIIWKTISLLPNLKKQIQKIKKDLK